MKSFVESLNLDCAEGKSTGHVQLQLHACSPSHGGLVRRYKILLQPQGVEVCIARFGRRCRRGRLVAAPQCSVAGRVSSRDTSSDFGEMEQPDIRQNSPMEEANEGVKEAASANSPSESLWEKVKKRVWLFFRLLRYSPIIVTVLARVHLFRRGQAEAIRRMACKWPVPVLDLPVNRDPGLRQRALNLPVAKTYPLMWQKMEGFCGDATVQNVLASAGICQLSKQERKHNTLCDIPAEVDRRISDAKLAAKVVSEGGSVSTALPSEHDTEVPRYAESWLHNKEWSFDSNALSRIKSWTVKAVSASEGYETFLRSVKRANDPDVRIFANYLRSPLLGLKKKLSMAELLAGHFSPIIGYMAPEELGMDSTSVSADSQHGDLTRLVDDTVTPGTTSYGVEAKRTITKRHSKSKSGEMGEGKATEGREVGGESGSADAESRDGYVVLMDLNAKYGLMIVPVEQMYDTVATTDFVVDTMRGLVVVDMVQQ